MAVAGRHMAPFLKAVRDAGVRSPGFSYCAPAIGLRATGGCSRAAHWDNADRGRTGSHTMHRRMSLVVNHAPNLGLPNPLFVRGVWGNEDAVRLCATRWCCDRRPEVDWTAAFEALLAHVVPTIRTIESEHGLAPWLIGGAEQWLTVTPRMRHFGLLASLWGWEWAEVRRPGTVEASLKQGDLECPIFAIPLPIERLLSALMKSQCQHSGVFLLPRERPITSESLVDHYVECCRRNPNRNTIRWEFHRSALAAASRGGVLVRPFGSHDDPDASIDLIAAADSPLAMLLRAAAECGPK